MVSGALKISRPLIMRRALKKSCPLPLHVPLVVVEACHAGRVRAEGVLTECVGRAKPSSAVRILRRPEGTTHERCKSMDQQRIREPAPSPALKAYQEAPGEARERGEMRLG